MHLDGDSWVALSYNPDTIDVDFCRNPNKDAQNERVRTCKTMEKILTRLQSHNVRADDRRHFNIHRHKVDHWPEDTAVRTMACSYVRLTPIPGEEAELPKDWDECARNIKALLQGVAGGDA